MLPSLIYLGLVILGLGVSLMTHNHLTQISFWSKLFRVLVVMGILYWGGFFDKLINAI